MIITVFTCCSRRFLVFSLSEEAALTCWVVFMAEEQRYTVKADAQSSEPSQRTQHNILYTCCCWPRSFPHLHPHPLSSTPNVQWTRCRRWWRATKHTEKTIGFELVKGCSGSVPLNSHESPTSCILAPLPGRRNEFMLETPNFSGLQTETGQGPADLLLCDNICSFIFIQWMEKCCQAPPQSPWPAFIKGISAFSMQIIHINQKWKVKWMLSLLWQLCDLLMSWSLWGLLLWGNDLSPAACELRYWVPEDRKFSMSHESHPILSTSDVLFHSPPPACVCNFISSFNVSLCCCC